MGNSAPDPDDIAFYAQRSAERAADRHPAIEARRGVCGGRPVFAGTRLEPSLVWRYLAAGHGVDKLLADYPTLTSADVALAKKLLAEALRFVNGRARP